jgi:hypothetical protein
MSSILARVVNRFPEKPPIYNVLWKTAIWQVAALGVRSIEHSQILRDQSGLIAWRFLRVLPYTTKVR